MAIYPKAIWKPFPGIGAYVGGPFKIVHHTTEGGSAAGAIATYAQTKAYPHFTVEKDVVYQHVDTNAAVTALEHRSGTPETNRSSAIQIELVGFAGKPKSPVALRTMAALCRWLEQQHGVPPVWPNGKPYPPDDGGEPDGEFNRNAHNWATKGGHYGHCHVPNNSHWDPGYTEEELALVMAGADVEAVAAQDGELESIPEMASAEAASDRPAVSPYAQSLARIAKAEFAAFGEVSETDQPLRSRIDDYCRGIGIAPPADITAFPWSATFVSWCVKQAGASADEFHFSAAHAVFVQAAIRNADNGTGVFRARRIEDYAPRVGDIIQRNRSGGTITYDAARRSANYVSHSAIVVEVGQDRQGQYALTIGGNESDSVGRRRVALDASGRVVQLASNPFICIVQTLKIDAQPLSLAEAPPPAPVPPPAEAPPPDGETEFDAPDAGQAADSPAVSQAVAAPAIRASAAPGREDLFNMHGRLASRIFAHHAQVSAQGLESPAAPGTKAVVGVGIGAARRDMESVGPDGPGAPVLNVYVAEKMDMDSVKRTLVEQFDMQELRPDRQRVNIYHTGPISKRSQRDYVRPSPCGVSVGHRDVTAGTQGALARGLKDARRKRLLMLSNNHVLANSNAGQERDPVYQPGRYDMGAAGANPGPFQVGILERWVPIDFAAGAENYVDCATAWCWPDRVRRDFVRPNNAGGSEYFRVGARPKEAARQMLVGKTGRTTELTSGEVLDVNAAITVNYDGRPANFVDQITIKGLENKRFSAGGDSGSLIWTWDAERAPVGLLFAGGVELTFANKIQHVLEALDVELQT